MNERDRTRGAPERRGPTRTCVGCGKPAGAEDLVRVVLGPRPSADAAAPVAVDLDEGGTHGRGAHVHASPACLAKAAKGGLARSFKAKVDATDAELAAQIVAACDRRVSGLLAGAYRGRMLAVGADAVLETLAKAKVKPMLVVACDAASVVDRGAIAEAIAEGRAVAWKDKATLGALCQRDEVAVLAVSNDSVAAQIARARRMADAVAMGGQRGQARGERCRSREVR